MRDGKHVILKVLVGSRAHRLHDEDSDYDYRSVYVIPTEDILSLGFRYKGTSWIEGNEDDTAYEVGHFLSLATKCNPTILEVFLAPIVEITPLGAELRDLFPKVWNTNDAFNAFVGYGLNQRKKFLDRKDNREIKYAVAYIRVLYNLTELLESGTFTIAVGDTPIGEKLRRYKKGYFTTGEVIDEAEKLIARASYLKEAMPEHEADLEAVNRYLLKVRRKFFSEEK